MDTALTSPSETPAAPRPTMILSKRQKAAVVVRSLLSEDADFSLTGLGDPTLVDLGHQLTTLSHIDQATIDDVIHEFLGEMEGGKMTFPKGLNSAFNLLEKAVSPETNTRLRLQAGLEEADPWKRLGELELDVLLGPLESESIQIAAVLLSKLKVGIAAELLGRLPGERARRITFAISQTGGIKPEMVTQIGETLVDQLDVTTISAFSEGPVERIGAILNFSPAATRDDVLVGLSETDSSFAADVKRAIFTFANVPERIEPRDIPKIIRIVAPEDLITALTAAAVDNSEAVEFVLDNMSKRMAGQLREDMEAKGSVPLKEGETAMNAVVSAIRELEASGDIFLVIPADDEE